MKNLYLLCLLLIVIPLNFSAQDSDQKEEILSARKSEKEKEQRRKDCRKMPSEQSIQDNRCYETYPTEIMTWGKGFSNGLAKISVNGKIGFINTEGEIVIKPTLKDAGHFSENLAPFESNNGKWGYINTKGEIIIKPQFDWAISFHEGLGLIQVGKLWGYIDHEGKIVIEPKFEEASSFEEDFAVVGWYDKDYVWTSNMPRTGKWQRNFIDTTGKLRFLTSFDGIDRNFDGGMAIVSRSLGYSEKFKGMISETFVIDTSGSELWKLNSWYITWFRENLIVVAVSRDEETKRDKYSFLDRNGKRVTERTYGSLEAFSEGLAVASINGKDGFIDKTGEFVIEPKYYDADSFSEGLAAVREDGKSGFIDTQGNWKFELKFDWTDGFTEGRAAIAVGEKVGYIDRNGNYIWKPTK